MSTSPKLLLVTENTSKNRWNRCGHSPCKLSLTNVVVLRYPKLFAAAVVRMTSYTTTAAAVSREYGIIRNPSAHTLERDAKRHILVVIFNHHPKHGPHRRSIANGPQRLAAAKIVPVTNIGVPMNGYVVNITYIFYSSHESLARSRSPSGLHSKTRSANHLMHEISEHYSSVSIPSFEMSFIHPTCKTTVQIDGVHSLSIHSCGYKDRLRTSSKLPYITGETTWMYLLHTTTRRGVEVCPKWMLNLIRLNSKHG